MEILELKNITIRFGGLVAVEDLNIEVKEKEILGLIGPNGAGKSTVFNMITGIYKPTEGNIIFDGQTLVRRRAYRIASMGITRTFQSIRLFSTLTVLDNVMIGCHVICKSDLISSVLRRKSMVKEEEELRKKSMEVLEFVNLAKKCNEKANNLSYGEQRKLEIARGLVSDPKIILLDEPGAGMNPQEKAVLMDIINKIRDRGVTVILVEHDMSLVMGISDRIVVLDHGKKIAEGLPSEIQENEQVIHAYLGAERYTN